MVEVRAQDRGEQPGADDVVRLGAQLHRKDALEELVGERPPTTEQGTRALVAPRFLDIHRITDTHEHIGMIYWARPRNGEATLSADEHHDIRWCSSADLDTLRPPMSHAVKWYCRKALEEVRAAKFRGHG